MKAFGVVLLVDLVFNNHIFSFFVPTSKYHVRLTIVFIISALAVFFSRQEARASDSDSIRDVGQDLPSEHISLPNSLDEELEQLLELWLKGYSRRTQSGRSLRPCQDDERTVIPTTPDSVYIDRLSKLPTVIPVTFNPVVKDCVELYVERRRSLLRSMLTLGDLYFPQIEEALDKHGLPTELKYLTIVESALNPTAVSPAGASGLWQFMLATAKIYGLTVNSLIDERLDPKKSTEAACRYLKDMYQIYGDWLLVIASYNCGPGNVNRAIRSAGGKANFWAIYPYLPKETRRYVPLFIGAYYAMHYHSEHNICPREMGVPLATDTLMLHQIVDFKRIEQLSGVPESDLKLLNPQYRRGIVPGHIRPYPILLPMSAASALDKQRDSLCSPDLNMKREGLEQHIVEVGDRSASKYHRVRKGDTLGHIARTYGTSVQKLRRLNGVRAGRLKPGMRIRVR